MEENTNHIITWITSSVFNSLHVDMNTLFRVKKQQFKNNNSKQQISPQFCAHLFPFNRTKIAWGCEQGEQGWRGSDCTRLPRTWPVFDLGLAVTCGLNCLLVLYSAPRDFSPGSPVFPSPQKPTIPIGLFNKPQSAMQSVQSAMLEGKLRHWDIKSSFTG